MQPTRWEILQILKRRGETTVEEFSRALEMTPMAVRLHLVVLERDGLVSRRTIRRGPGRPTMVYSLTEEAQEYFPKSYHLLAELLLQAIRDQSGETGVETVCDLAATRLAETFRGRLANRDLAGKVEEVTRILNETGCYATWEKAEEGYVIREQNCPYYRVARQHREVCAIDHEFLTKILDTAVERRACLFDDLDRCEYLVPTPPKQP
jgi:predicted ArsR family transcriptional regulator